MGEQNVAYLAFNRGLVDPKGLARIDIKRLALSGEVWTNWVPRVLGSMMVRPGLKYLAESRNNAKAFHMEFVFAVDDKALVEMTDQIMRVYVDDEIISRPAVSTVITNGTFDSNLTGWTDADQSGAVSAWETGGYMGLTGTGVNSAIRRQQVTVATPNTEHALHIVVQRGPVVLLVGSSSGGGQYIDETTLDTGVHSLAFTPSTSSFWVEFQNHLSRLTLVDSCVIESQGDMEIATPFLEADLPYLRYDQSGDIIFIACAGYQQRKIERRATRSWSCVKYYAENGPMRVQNTGPVTITPSAISGNITLTASDNLWRQTHVGALWQITSIGQTVATNIVAENTFTSSIRVTGTGTSRSFTISLTGTWTATVTLQRSFDEGATWIDLDTYTANTATTYSDGLDNQIVLYRIGVKTGDFTSGTVAASLAYALGSITGYARITAFSTTTSVSAEVLSDLGGTTATDNWAEGEWSDYRGWPGAVTFYEGRIWWAGKDKNIGSESDAFYSFNSDTVGDSGPINRTIGSGPVDTVNWLLPLSRLILGAQMAEFSCRSNSLDEPLTPSNYNCKPASRQGSAPCAAKAMDSTGIYVQRGGYRVMEISFDSSQAYDFTSTQLSAMVPKIGEPGIVRIGVQRQPDPRVHCVRSDGTVAMLVYDKLENVTCWIEIETDGQIEDVVILPQDEGEPEDRVYYLVKRTTNGVTKRYLERWATEGECEGVSGECLMGDSFVRYQGTATRVITGLDHLEGENVVVWADGVDVGTIDPTTEYGEPTQRYTVSGGQITLDTAAADVMVGRPYEAEWKGGKMGQIQAQAGVALSNQKRIPQIGLIMAQVHAKGLRYGPDFDHLENLPEVEEGAIIDPDTIRTAYDEPVMPFPATWTTDTRVCLKGYAPRPCTVLAAIAWTQTT